MAVSGLSGVTAISARDPSCALLSDGSVECWGANPSGELGNGTTTSSLTPVAVSGLSRIVAIATGNGYACALLSGGSVRCWGAIHEGPPGGGATSDSSTPVAVSGLGGVAAIAIADQSPDPHSCVLLSSGSVECWGSNTYGELGNGTETGSLTPVAVSSLSGATAIAADNEYTCALLSGGSVECWGAYVQLASGPPSLTPVAVMW